MTLAVAGEIVCGAARVIGAEADPFGPEAVTVTEAEADKVVGAVNRPEELIVPEVDVQLLAPTELNCCVLPRRTVAEVGEIVCGVEGRRVTEAMPEPLEPVPVIKTEEVEGMLEGAVNNPVESIFPAEADHAVAPAAENC